MKATKLILIAIILTIGMVGITSNADARGLYGNKVLYMDLEDAVKNPAIVQVMYEQINSSFLGSVDGEYTVTILYNGVITFITGSYTEWFMFFQMRKRINPQEM